MKPSFYDSFRCIAGDCDFTCCQQWKIGVDDETARKWEKIKLCHIADNVKNADEDCMLSEITTMKDEQRVIALNEKKVCPLLCDNGLCSLVLRRGEESISQTCHIFPRENHEFVGHTEKTLMPCCPYVIDLLKAEETFTVISEGESPQAITSENVLQYIDGSEVTDHGLFELRSIMMEYIQRNSGDCYVDGATTNEMLKAIYYMLLECLEDGTYDRDKWLLMPELIDTVRKMDEDVADNLNECNELFLDVVDNYVKEGLYEDYLAGICEEAVLLEEALEDGEGAMDDVVLFEQFMSEYDRLYDSILRKYLAQEFYADLFLPEGDIESAVVHYQWIAMEYVVIRQIMFLNYRKQLRADNADREMIMPYKVLRDSIVLASRIMGYEEDDIYEYLENSFEELIWEWGYMALIIGR